MPGALGGAAAACGAGAPWRSSGVESVGAGAAVWVWRWWSFFREFHGNFEGEFHAFFGEIFDFEGISMGFSQGYVIFLHFKMFSFYVSDNYCNITKQMMIKKDECGE